MSVHIYARATKLTDVVGRVDYIGNPDRQENLLVYTSTVSDDPTFWAELAEDCQDAWRRSGGAGQKTSCCEAREFHGDLPMSAMSKDLNQVAEKIAADFKARTGAECAVAIHLNKDRTNLHYHLIFSERQRLAEPEIRLADRNAFIDEKGVRKRTKKEILDESGQLRPGCRIVKKGEILYARHFSEKEEIMKEKAWVHDFKAHMADWINQELQPDQKREVFDQKGPYLAQIHVGKGRSAEQKQKIETWNRNVKVFNAAVKDGRIDKERALEIKAEVMLAPKRNAALVAIIKREFGNQAPEVSAEYAGGSRSAVGPDEEKKQKLRSLYQKAGEARRKARAFPKGSPDRSIYFAQARQYSAQIDRLRRELGYYTNDDYDRRRELLEEDLRRKREWVLRCRERTAYYARRAHYLTWRIESIKKELADMPVFFKTKEQQERENQLRKELVEAKEARADAWYAVYKAKKQYREEKKAARIKKREIREEKRELRAMQRAQSKSKGIDR